MRVSHSSGHTHSRKHLLKIGAIAAACYIVVLAGIWLIFGNLEKGEDVPEPVGSLDGRFDYDDIRLERDGKTYTYRKRALINLLFIGIDWADVETDTTTLRYSGQSDFMLLMTIDKKNKSIHTLHIDRDTITPVRVYGPFGDFAGTKDMQICLSYAYGEDQRANCENAVWAASNLLKGVPIDYYIVVDMEGISVLNDALGGVTVTLEDDFSHSDPEMTKGSVITLKGKQAELYVRGRMGIGEGTNSSRMVRQRTFMKQAMQMLVDGMKKDLDFIGKLYDEMDEHAETNIDRGWIINKAYESADYEREEMLTIAGTHEIGEDGFMEFHPDEDALLDMLTTYYFE